MTQVNESVAGATTAGRLGRLPFALLLTLGLLVSLIHCAGDLGFNSAKATTLAMKIDQGSTKDTPEQLLPCHSGHCLSHVTDLYMAAVVTPADLVARAPRSGQEQFPAALGGLPPFKPPRA
ncbi:MAG: ferrichrome ABC transporter substrate-binding protein [Bradyrhizobium sp.]